MICHRRQQWPGLRERAQAWATPPRRSFHAGPLPSAAWPWGLQLVQRKCRAENWRQWLPQRSKRSPTMSARARGAYAAPILAARPAGVSKLADDLVVSFASNRAEL